MAETVFSCRLQQSLLFLKLQTFTMDGNDEFVAESVTESVFSLTLSWYVFSIAVGLCSDRVCDGVCF